MVEDLALDQPLTNGPSEQGLKAPTGVEVVVKHEKPHADRRFRARDLINALHNADRRGKEYFPPRGA
jgi:hypothetical protein